MLGIQAAAANAGVQVYPNPNNGTFSIELNGSSKGAELVIYNSIGEEVLRKTLQKTQTGISGLQPGLYYLQFRVKDQMISKKVHVY